jgi:glycosyltransferase involved in cell wall biosynthesis
VTESLVSVIMPVFNAEAFVAEALQSVLAQDYRPFEVLVVNDGSRDDSGVIVRSFTSVRYFEQDNQGASAARNLAARHASGEFVAFVDADDVVPADKLTVQVGHLLSHPETGAVFGRQHWMQEPPGVVRDPIYGDLDGIPLVSMVVRKTILDEVGEFGEPPHEDMDFLIRFKAAGHRYTVLPEIVLNRRYHGANLYAGQGLNPLRIRSLKAKLDAERARQENQ